MAPRRQRCISDTCGTRRNATQSPFLCSLHISRFYLVCPDSLSNVGRSSQVSPQPLRYPCPYRRDIGFVLLAWSSALLLVVRGSLDYRLAATALPPSVLPRLEGSAAHGTVLLRLTQDPTTSGKHRDRPCTHRTGPIYDTCGNNRLRIGRLRLLVACTFCKSAWRGRVATSFRTAQ